MKEIQYKLTRATASYEHLCCEQTSAKIFACFCIISIAIRENPSDKDLLISRAKESIKVGLKRQESMWIPKVGFQVYPGCSHCSIWGRLATENLLKITLFSGHWPEDSAIQQLFLEVQNLAESAAKAYKIQWPIVEPSSMWESYALACQESSQKRDLASNAIDWLEDFEGNADACHRHDKCMAAATLLKVGNNSQIATAAKLASQLFEGMTSQGRLYSTIESVGAVFLAYELSQRNWGDPRSKVLLNGNKTLLGEIEIPILDIKSIVSLNDQLPVKITTVSEVDWTQKCAGVPIEYSFWVGKKKLSKIHVGDRFELRVRVCRGNDGAYRMGDFLWIALPPCLSRLKSGGLVRQFSIDLEGKDGCSIPLIATESTTGSKDLESVQHFVIHLRNMYEEDRLGSPGPIGIQVFDRISRRSTLVK